MSEVPMPWPRKAPVPTDGNDIKRCEGAQHTFSIARRRDRLENH